MFITSRPEHSADLNSDNRPASSRVRAPVHAIYPGDLRESLNKKAVPSSIAELNFKVACTKALAHETVNTAYYNGLFAGINVDTCI
jgi:hypothetical protein